MFLGVSREPLAAQILANIDAHHAINGPFQSYLAKQYGYEPA